MFLYKIKSNSDQKERTFTYKHNMSQPSLPAPDPEQLELMTPYRPTTDQVTLSAILNAVMDLQDALETKMDAHKRDTDAKLDAHKKDTDAKLLTFRRELAKATAIQVSALANAALPLPRTYIPAL